MPIHGLGAAGSIDGHVEPGFGPVADVRNFLEHGEVGAGLSVYLEGRLVVDLWGGMADPASGKPWTARTPTGFQASTSSRVSGASTALSPERWLEQVPGRHLRLASCGELRPVARDRCVEVEETVLHEEVWRIWRGSPCCRRTYG